jgi:hypothetical protein
VSGAELDIRVDPAVAADLVAHLDAAGAGREIERIPLGASGP